ncbi:hypothetical protein JCM24511_05274 [Saitozyma sp. JCM 24511]|nr:hypothetical protein JCM24511_05274 [Saitozyma sp. JCM 24511]
MSSRNLSKPSVDWGSNHVTFLNWYGRRNLYITGAACGTVIRLVIGFLDFAATSHLGARWPQAALIIFNLISACYMHPLMYLTISVPSTRLRSKTVALASDAYFVSQTAAGIGEHIH